MHNDALSFLGTDINKTLSFDPLSRAETITGKSYKTDKETESIGVALAIGWINDIEKFSECDFQAPYKCEIVHGLSLIPPVGMITGWLNVGI